GDADLPGVGVDVRDLHRVDVVEDRVRDPAGQELGQSRLEALAARTVGERVVSRVVRQADLTDVDDLESGDVDQPVVEIDVVDEPRRADRIEVLPAADRHGLGPFDPGLVAADRGEEGVVGAQLLAELRALRGREARPAPAPLYPPRALPIDSTLV